LSEELAVLTSFIGFAFAIILYGVPKGHEMLMSEHMAKLGLGV
jgi:hypothetical protein